MKWRDSRFIQLLIHPLHRCPKSGHEEFTWVRASYLRVLWRKHMIMRFVNRRGKLCGGIRLRDPQRMSFQEQSFRALKIVNLIS